jgi:hypothetical protein
MGRVDRKKPKLAEEIAAHKVAAQPLFPFAIC